ncbi:hypothetical protein ACQW02_25660 [Humitalea sp. 24SJ18S-53]|uniref:hypothetical protein n=1 Tax=Humitalea sp. 24SJ18S-53 TaxID=3422307 RepID=UPI003D6656E6
MATDDLVSAAVLAADWDVTPRLVRRLAQEGVIPREPGGRYGRGAATRAYCRRLREQAAGRAGRDGSGLDLVEQRARLARAQADGQAMKNALTRGDLVPARDVVAGMQGAFANARAKLLGIPSKAAPLLVGVETPTEVREVLTGLVYEALAELGATRAVSGG